MFNSVLVDFIVELSKKDTKTTSQKALKACEEVGELAKAVLPYENAHGTNHRFADGRKVLEEVADTILTAVSVAFDLGYTPADVEEMVTEKSRKWAGLQAREAKIKGPIPYEIHITVSAHDGESFATDVFKKDCQAIGVKPVIIDNQDNNGETVFYDSLTSSIYVGDNRGAYQEMKRISKAIASGGFKILREKIETVPWHPAAPSEEHIEPKMPPNCYFETHFAVVLDEAQLPLLRKMSAETGTFISQNVSKRLDNNRFKIMLTYRRYTGTYESFVSNQKFIKKVFEEAGFDMEKEITEFSVYDSKISHDDSWINA